MTADDWQSLPPSLAARHAARQGEVDFLIELLSSSDPRARISAAGQLRKLQDAKAVPALVGCLQVQPRSGRSQCWRLSERSETLAQRMPSLMSHEMHPGISRYGRRRRRCCWASVTAGEWPHSLPSWASGTRGTILISESGAATARRVERHWGSTRPARRSVGGRRDGTAPHRSRHSDFGVAQAL